MEDRDRVAGLVGHKVAVMLSNVEAGSVEIIATLDWVRGDGIVLPEIGDLAVDSYDGPWIFSFSI